MFAPRGTQKPTLQKVSVPHCVQTSPPEPQPFWLLPVRHSPLAESQQPVQVLVLHFGTVTWEHEVPKPSIEMSRRRRTPL